MKVKVKKEITVDGKKHAKGAEFDMANSAAAYTAQEDGLVDVLDEPPTSVAPGVPAVGTSKPKK